MFGDGSLTFREFISRERLPLARVHDGVLDWLRSRQDAVLCGAHAVNAYVRPSRMTQDVDIISTRASELAKELCGHLRERFQMAVVVREAKNHARFRIGQRRKPVYRHLVDVWQVDVLPPGRRVKKVLVTKPPELIAAKVVSMVGRPRKLQSLMDKVDLLRLLLAFPELKAKEGPVAAILSTHAGQASLVEAWKALVAQEIQPDDDDDKFVR